MIVFEEEFDRFLNEQRSKASGMRREMLDRDLTGTKKLIEKVRAEKAGPSYRFMNGRSSDVRS